MSDPSIVSECRSNLREYDLCVIVDDSDDMAGSIWCNVKDLLVRLSDETKFDLIFVNHGESGSIESHRDVEDVMNATVPSGGRAVLSVLDRVIMAEMDALCEVDDISQRNKLRIVVILFDLPTDPAPLTLNVSVDLAVKSLDSAQLASDRIGISFVQMGFSHRLRQTLKVLEDDIPHRRPEYTNMARFIRYARSMDTPTLWKILLGGVCDQLRRRTTSLSAAITSPSRLAVVRRHTAPPQDGPLLNIPGFLWDRGFRTAGTYDLSGGFTFMGWISEKDRTAARAHDFLTFFNGSSPLFRVTIGEAEGDTIGIWSLNMSGNPSAQGFPINFWTFFCVIYDGRDVHFGLHGSLNNIVPLNRIPGLDKVHIVLCPSRTSPHTSLANIKVYNRILVQSDVIFEYTASRPDA